MKENVFMKNYRMASIPADGIGPEVIAEGVKVLNAVAASQFERVCFS